ncbi:MAG TPA: hypothetical protein VF784_07710 [Anaerolineales bacterium]
MSFQLLDRVRSQITIAIEQAVLETVAYSDVFDYPVRAEEIHRYLPLRVSLDELRHALDSGMTALGHENGYYFLKGRDSLVATRSIREAISRPAWKRAQLFGRILGGLPFVRMVALTGSLALLNSEESGDMDYMLVAAPGRVWTARGFAVLFGRLTARVGSVLCPNLIVSENALAWGQRDLYSARELCQMVPITGASLYTRLRRINDWTEDLLPNGWGPPALARPISERRRVLQITEEWALRGSLGARIETWEMRRKISRLSRQAGRGVETRFDAEVCQGNFQHHGAQTRQAVRERLAQLGIDSPLSMFTSDSK